MGLEEFSSFAPMRQKALLLPVGRIKSSRYTAFIDRLLPENIVRLGDISPDGRSDRTMFSPLAFPDGRLVYEFSTSLSASRQSVNEPVKLLLEPLILIGIADAKEYEGLTGAYYQPDTGEGTRQQPQVVRDIESVHEAMIDVRGSFQKVLCHTLLLFDCSPSIRLPLLPEYTFLVPPIEHSKTTTVKTVLCDLTAAFLADLSLLGRAILARHPLDVHRSGRNPAGRHSDPQSAAYAASLSSTTRLPVWNLGPTAASAAELQHNHPHQRPESNQRAHNQSGIAAGTEVSYPGTATSELQQRIVAIMETRPLCELDPKWRPGRISVVIGTLFLAAGRWHDALRLLVQAAARARDSDDHLFHGKALEHLSICVLLLAAFRESFEVPPNLLTLEQATEENEAHAGSSFPWNGDASKAAFDKLKARIFATQDKILDLYKRVPIAGLHYNISVMIFCLLRISLSDVDTPDQLNLEEIIRGTSIPLVARTTGLLPTIRPSSGRLEIAKLLINATKYPDANRRFRFPQAATLQAGADSVDKLLEEVELIEEEATFLAGCVLVLRSLYMNRKSAVCLSEFFRLQRAVLERLGEISNAQSGGHLSQYHNIESQEELNLSPDQEQELLGIAQLVACFLDLEDAMNTTHLIYLAAENFFRDERESNVQFLRDALRTWRVHGLGNLNVVKDIYKVCISLFKERDKSSGEALAAKAIREHEARMHIIPTSLYHYSSLDEGEFRHLFHDLLQTRLDLRPLAAYDGDYWDELLVCGLHHNRGPSDSTNVTKLSFSDVEDLAPNSQNGIESSLIHSSFTITSNASAEADTLVAGEHTEFLVSLRNANEVEVIVDAIDVVTEGVNFDIDRDAMQHKWVLKPHSLQTLAIVGTAQGPGIMKVTRCNVKLRGYREREFCIFRDIRTLEPVSDKPSTKWEDGMIFRGLAQGRRDERSDSERLPVPESKSFLVIEKQPVLVLTSESPRNSALMIMGGETDILSLELRNTSDVGANFLRLQANDSTVAECQASISRKDVSEVEFYELEWSQIHAKGVELCDSHTIAASRLEPGVTKALAVKVYGKPGLTRGYIRLFYANISAHSDPRNGVFVRQATFDFHIFVLPSLQLLRRVDGVLNPAKAQCLLALQFHNPVKNVLNLSITVDCKRDNSSDGHSPEPQTYNFKVAPGAYGVPVSVPPLYVGNPYRPIPLPKKQYVVSAVSEDAARAERKSFWIREALLGALSGRWKDGVTGREGKLNFRRLRLNAGCEEALAALAVYVL